jgi:hypothetical protein
MGLFHRKGKDDCKALLKQRRAVEDEKAWFEQDDDGPDLNVETGIGSNLRRRDDTD